MTQAQRDRAMKGFREGRFDVLVATDVMARGIDVANISHVINFDVPGTPDEYTHRVGRTGRAEKSGKAYTFAAIEELPAVHDIERVLKSKIPRREIPEFAAETVTPTEPRERLARNENPGREADGRRPRSRSRTRRRRPRPKQKAATS